MSSIIQTEAWPQRRGSTAVLRQSSTLAWRSLVSVRHNPTQLLEYCMLPAMILLSVTFFMGGQMMGTWQDFLQYGGPGIIVMGALFASLSTAVGFYTDVESGVFDRFSAMPLSRVSLIAGRVVADMVKLVWAIFAVGALAFAIGYRAEAGLWGILGAYLTILMFLFGCSWFMVFIGLVSKSEEQVQTYMISVIMPVSFTSTVYIEPHTLPSALEWWASINPMSFAADTVRAFLDGTAMGNSFWGLLAWTVGLTLVFMTLALRAYRRRLVT